MPIFEYKCLNKSCEKVREEFYHVGTQPLIISCYNCGNAAKRIMSTFHFEFKNVPKLIDKKRNKELALKREQLAEQNERGY